MQYEETDFIEYVFDKKPCVYIWTHKDKVTYVGYSSDINVGRPFRDNGDENNERTHVFQNKTNIYIKCFDSTEKAKNEELCLIHKYHPEENLRCDICKKSRRNILTDEALRFVLPPKKLSRNDLKNLLLTADLGKIR